MYNMTCFIYYTIALSYVCLLLDEISIVMTLFNMNYDIWRSHVLTARYRALCVWK